ncbi:MAG TPA: hypothetical protein VLC09_14225 [Polyangiaceae bacterium]|nr:hypothetical protein [Polyangiaceae bacterium]
MLFAPQVLERGRVSRTSALCATVLLAFATEGCASSQVERPAAKTAPKTGATTQVASSAPTDARLEASPKAEAPLSCHSFATAEELCAAWGRASGLAQGLPQFECGYSKETLGVNLVLHHLSFSDPCEDEEATAGACRSAVTQTDDLFAVERGGHFWPVLYTRDYYEGNGPVLTASVDVESLGKEDFTVRLAQTSHDGHHEAASNNLEGSTSISFLRATDFGPVLLAAAEIGSIWHGYESVADCSGDDCYEYVERDGSSELRRVAPDAFEITNPRAEPPEPPERLELNGTALLCDAAVWAKPENFR